MTNVAPTSFSGELPAQRPVTRSFHVFFDLHLNKRLSEQSRGWWFETPRDVLDGWDRDPIEAGSFM